MKNFILSVTIFYLTSTLALAQSPCQITLTNGAIAQKVCTNVAITPITYSVSGTSASVLGLPSGITGVYNANVFTISGTPTVSGVFDYTVTTTGGCNPDAMAVGGVTVNPLPIANITGSTSACQFDAIRRVTFYATGGTTPYTMGYSMNGVLDTVTQSIVDTLLFPVSTSDTGKFVFSLISVSDYNGCSGQIQNDSATIIIKNCIPHYTTVYDTLQNTFILTLDSSTFVNATGYNWFFGDGSVSILITPTHTYTNDTTYNVCLRITTATGDTSSYCQLIGKDSLGNIYRTSGFNLKVVAPQLVGIENNTLNKTISVSPNPFNNQLLILANKASSVKITNLSGTEVYHDNVSAGKSTINTNDFGSGVYLITITNEQTTVTKKLVKE